MTNFGDPGYVLQGQNNYDWYKRQQDAGSSDKNIRNDAQFNPVVVNGKRVPGVTEILITIHTLDQGLNKVWGSAHQRTIYTGVGDLDRIFASSLFTHDAGICSLPTLSTLDSVGETHQGILASTDIFGTHVVGTGSVANRCLFKETSRTDPTLTALNYDPGGGAKITYLGQTRIGSATQSRRLAVCKNLTASPIEILSDVAATPTSAGTMHVNTGACWGFLESPLNSASPGAPVMAIYSHGQLWTLDMTQSIGTAPTSATSGVATVPNGGYPVGAGQLPGVPESFYWFFPTSDQTQDSLYEGTSGYMPFAAGYLVRTNFECTDLQTVYLPFRPLWAAQIDDQTIWVSEGSMVWEVSDKIRNLNWATQRTQNSSSQKQAVGALSAKGVGHILSVTDDMTASGSATLALERYERSTNTWHQISGNNASVSASAWPTTSDFPLRYQYALMAPGSLPYSGITGHSHIALNNTAVGATAGRFYHQYVPTDGQPVFYNNNDTAGVSTTNRQQYESTGSVTGPALTFEEVPGQALVLEEIRCLGDLAAGGTDCQVDIEMAVETSSGFNFTNSVKRSFFGRDRPSKHRAYLGENHDWASRFQWKATITRGASTYQTPNILPLQFRLLAFEDPDMVRSPAEVRAG